MIFIRHKSSPRTLFCATSTDPESAWCDFITWLGCDQRVEDYEWCYIMDGSDGLKAFLTRQLEIAV